MALWKGDSCDKIKYNMHTHVIQMSCMWFKDGFILNSIVGNSLGCPLFQYLKVVGYPLNCPLSCQLFPYLEVEGSLICMAKFPYEAHGQPTALPTILIIWSSGLPTVAIFESSGQPNLHGKIVPICSPMAAHCTAHFFSIIWRSGLPTVSILK